MMGTAKSRAGARVVWATILGAVCGVLMSDSAAAQDRARMAISSPMAEVFITADRKMVPIPNIDAMVEAGDCTAMVEVLERIDASEYRAGRPGPKNIRDEPLFEYEQRLSIAFYQACDAPQPNVGQRRGFGLSAN